MYRKILLILVLVNSLLGSVTNNDGVRKYKLIDKIYILPGNKYLYSLCLDGYLYYMYPTKNLVQANSTYSGGSQPIKCNIED